MFRFFSRSALLSAGVIACLAAGGCSGKPKGRVATDLRRLEPLEYGKPVRFSRDGDGTRLLLNGWADPEYAFTWSDGIAASLAVRVPQTQEPVELEFRICGMNAPKRLPSQRVDVYINSEKVARWQVADEETFKVRVPQKFVSAADSFLVVDFYIPHAAAPVSLGLGGDRRQLGIRLSDLVLSKAPPEEPTNQPSA